MSTRRKLLYGFTAFVLLTLALLPATGWIVRLQAFGLFGKTFPGWQSSMTESGRDLTTENYVHQHPTDFTAQLATAIAGESRENVTRLTALCEAYPNSVPARAALLRFSCDLIDVGHLKEQAALSSRPETFEIKTDPKKNRPEDLARFDAIAKEGEALDPDNAFFPVMRALGLYAQNRDTEAGDAIRRASEKQVFQDYLADDLEARWQANVAAYGQEIGSLPRYSILSAVSFTHYAPIRKITRIAIGQAIEAELDGRIAEGLTIRKTVTRLGATIRVGASTNIGSIVGSATTEMAATRPGGVRPLRREDDSRLRQQQLRDTYCAYLTRLGETKEADYFRAEIAAREQMRRVSHRASDISWIANPEVERLFPLWGMVSVVMASLTGLVGFTGLFALLHRFSRRTQAEKPMSLEAKWGVYLGCAVAFVGLVVKQLGETELYAELTGGVVGVSALLFTITPVLGRFRLGQFGRGLGTAALTVLFIGVFGVMMVTPLKSFLLPISHLHCWPESWLFTLAMPQGHYPILILANFLIFLPFLLVVGLAIFSRVLRVPISVGVVRSYRVVVGPILAFVLLGYAGLTVVTAVAEIRTKASLSEMVRNEGRYLSRITGMAWPGATPRP